MLASRRRCRSGSSDPTSENDCGRCIRHDDHEQCLVQVVARLLPAVVPYFRSHAVTDQVPLLAVLTIAAGPGQAPALSRAAFSNKDHDWLAGWRAPDPGTDDGSNEREEGSEEEAEEEEAAKALSRSRFNTGVAHVATRLLELAPRAVPEIVLYPCPGGRTVDIARVAVATQPGTVRRFALCSFAESEADRADAVEIWKLACATWGPSSLRDLCIENLPRDPLRCVALLAAAARCPHLEVLRIPRIVVPPALVALVTEDPSVSSEEGSASDSDAATPADGLCGPLPTARRVDVRLPPSPAHLAPYAATLRSLELAQGPDTAAEFAFIATQFPSLRRLVLVLPVFGCNTEVIPAGVWRRGLRQLLRQLHKLYIFSLDRPLCRALNSMHALAAADAQRSAALRLLPGTMEAILQPDSDETDGGSNEDTEIPGDAGRTAPAVMEDIPLRVFSIFGLGFHGPYSIAPFMRLLGQHAPFLTEVGLSRTTADTAAELITMRSPCRAVHLRDTRGLTDTIVASILQRHRATLRQILIDNIIEYMDVAEFDPRVYMRILGDKNAPQGVPFTKIAAAGLQQSVGHGPQQVHWCDEQRAYFSYLFPGLCDPRMICLLLLLESHR
jgi:hypothetical protein